MTIESTGPTPAEPLTAAAKPKSAFERLVGVFFAPTETFADIARKPDFLVPLLLLIVVGFGTTILIMPHFDWDSMMAQQLEMMQKQNPNMSEADMERIGNITRASAKVFAYLSPLWVVIGYLIIALVLWGAFRLMGGEGTYKQALSTTLYAYIPRMVLGSIIATIIIMLRGSVDPTQIASVVKTSPAFLADMKSQPVLYALLSSLDIFVVWTVILLVIGFSLVSRLSRAKSAAIIVGLWFVSVVVKIGLAALSAARMGG